MLKLFFGTVLPVRDTAPSTNRANKSSSIPQTTGDTGPIDFTTQADLIKANHAQDYEPGLCSPLTNLYSAYQMGKLTNKDSFRGAPASMYLAAVKERKKERELLSNLEPGHVRAS